VGSRGQGKWKRGWEDGQHRAGRQEGERMLGHGWVGQGRQGGEECGVSRFVLQSTREGVKACTLNQRIINRGAPSLLRHNSSCGGTGAATCLPGWHRVPAWRVMSLQDVLLLCQQRGQAGGWGLPLQGCRGAALHQRIPCSSARLAQLAPVGSGWAQLSSVHLTSSQLSSARLDEQEVLEHHLQGGTGSRGGRGGRGMAQGRCMLAVEAIKRPAAGTWLAIKGDGCSDRPSHKNGPAGNATAASCHGLPVPGLRSQISLPTPTHNGPAGQQQHCCCCALT